MGIDLPSLEAVGMSNGWHGQKKVYVLQTENEIDRGGSAQWEGMGQDGGSVLANKDPDQGSRLRFMFQYAPSSISDKSQMSTNVNQTFSATPVVVYSGHQPRTLSFQVFINDIGNDTSKTPFMELRGPYGFVTSRIQTLRRMHGTSIRSLSKALRPNPLILLPDPIYPAEVFRCLMTGCDVNILATDAKLRPIRATVDIQLIEFFESNVYALPPGGFASAGAGFLKALGDRK